jgi:hypothetical protein
MWGLRWGSIGGRLFLVLWLIFRWGMVYAGGVWGVRGLVVGIGEWEVDAHFASKEFV